MTVGRAELLEPVLARLVGALAARRELSVERVSDAVLVTDAIAGAAPGRFADGCVRLGLGESESGLELRLGPMEKGAAARFAVSSRFPSWAVRSRRSPMSSRSDESSDGDYLIVRFAGLPAA